MIRELLISCLFFAGLIFVDRYLTLTIGIIMCSLFSYYGTKIVIGNWEKIASSVFLRISTSGPCLEEFNSPLGHTELNSDDKQYESMEGTCDASSVSWCIERDNLNSDDIGRRFNSSYCGTVFSHSEEIRTFTREIFNHYMKTWYKNISNNEDTAEELKAILEDILQTAYNNISRICIVEILEKVIRLYSQHFHYYLQALDTVKERCGHASVKACIGMNNEIQSVYKMSHPALVDEDAEWCYLRSVMATVIDLFWPQEFLGCHAAYSMLEEILSKNVLFSLVNLLSDPDWLNQMITVLVSDTPVCVQKFYSNASDSGKESMGNGKNSEKLMSSEPSVSKHQNAAIFGEKSAHDYSRLLDNQLKYPIVRRHSDYGPKQCQKVLRHSRNERCRSSTSDVFTDFQDDDTQCLDTARRISSSEEKSSESLWEVWSNNVASKRTKLGIEYYCDRLIKLKSQSIEHLDCLSIVNNECRGEKNKESQIGLKKCWSVDCLSELNPLPCVFTASNTNSTLVTNKSDFLNVTVDLRRSKRESGVDVEEAQEATEVSWLDLFNEVKIIEAEMQEEAGKGTYHLYSIQYSALFLKNEEENSTQLVRNNVLVKRRFREFLALQSRLEDNPKLKKYIKKIKPPNKSIGSMFSPLDKRIVEERKQFLESYLQQLCSCKAVAASSELQEFLAYGGDASIAYVRKINEIPVPRIDKMFLKGVKGALDLLKTALPNIPQDDSSEKTSPTFSTKGIQSKTSFLPVFGKPKHDNHLHPMEVKYFGCNDSHLTQRLTEFIESFDMNSSEGSTDGRNDLIHRRIEMLDRTDSVSSIDIPLIFQQEGKRETTQDQKYFHQVFKGDMPLANAVLDLYLQSIKMFWPIFGNAFITNAVKISLGYCFDRWLVKKICFLFNYENCVNYLHLLHLSLWPERKEAAQEVGKKNTTEDSKHQRDAAFTALKLFLPGILSKILGKETFESSILLLHDSLQYSKLNRCLVYHILDKLMDHLSTEEGHHVH